MIGGRTAHNAHCGSFARAEGASCGHQAAATRVKRISRGCFPTAGEQTKSSQSALDVCGSTLELDEELLREEGSSEELRRCPLLCLGRQGGVAAHGNLIQAEVFSAERGGNGEPGGEVRETT